MNEVDGVTYRRKNRRAGQNRWFVEAFHALMSCWYLPSGP